MRAGLSRTTRTGPSRTKTPEEDAGAGDGTFPYKEDGIYTPPDLHWRMEEIPQGDNEIPQGDNVASLEKHSLAMTFFIG